MLEGLVGLPAAAVVVAAGGGLDWKGFFQGDELAVEESVLQPARAKTDNIARAQHKEEMHMIGCPVNADGGPVTATTSMS